MALPPQLPEPQHRSQKRLSDQAIFLGDLGRSGKAVQGGVAKETRARFEKLLEQLDDEGEASPAEVPAEPAAEAGKQAEGASDVQDPIRDDQLENRKDAERRSARGGEDEAEKASAGLWRGPHPSMGLAMANITQQLQARAIDKQERTQKQRDASDSESVDDEVRSVESGLVQALKDAGLAQPLTGFSDPRLRSGAPLLGSEWVLSQFPGGKVFRWEGGTARQVLRWSEKDCLLETIGAGRRQVIQKIGEQQWSQTTPWSEDQGVDFGNLKRPL